MKTGGIILLCRKRENVEMSLNTNRIGDRQPLNKQARIIWIDVIKGIGILLVVLGHTNPPFMKIIYGFHMPLFLLFLDFYGKNALERHL